MDARTDDLLLSSLGRRPADLSFVAITSRKYYPNFDVLRLLLAAEVAFAHAWGFVDPNFGWNGFVMAVPAFLAISGFLVLQSYESSHSWRHFLKKRVLRIGPALLASFVLCFVLLGPGATYRSFVVWISGGLIDSGGRSPLWSLAWEELAYLMLAGLWLLGAYRRPIYIWALLALSLLFCRAFDDLAPQNRMILFLPCAFFVGNLAYLYRDRLMGLGYVAPLVGFYVMLRWQNVPDAGWFGGADLAVVQAFGVVWLGMAGLRIIPWRMPDLSYSLYIYHWPVLLFLMSTFRITTLPDLLAAGTAVLLPLCLVSWYLMEKPALRLKRS